MVWLPAKSDRVEPSTADQYTWAVRRHVVALIGATRRTDLRPEMLDQWVGFLVATLPMRARRRMWSTAATAS